MMVDPVASLIVFLAFAVLWLSSGVSKLRHGRRFEAALSAYQVLPSPRLVQPVAYALALSELVVGVFALMRWPGTGVASLILLLVYVTAMSVNLLRGRRDLDCGCTFAGTSRSTISEWLVARNVALAGLSLVMLVPVSSRVMGAGDLLTVAAGVASAGIFYQAANQLSATSIAPWATSNELAADPPGGR